MWVFLRSAHTVEVASRDDVDEWREGLDQAFVFLRFKGNFRIVVSSLTLRNAGPSQMSVDPFPGTALHFGMGTFYTVHDVDVVADGTMSRRDSSLPWSRVPKKC